MVDTEGLDVILLGGDDSLAAELQALSSDAAKLEGSGFDGLDTLIVSFATLSTPVVAAIAKVAIEAIRARKTVRFRYKGVTVEGISESSVLKMFERIQGDIAS